MKRRGSRLIVYGLWLLIVVPAVMRLYLIVTFRDRFVFPLDDSYIYLRFAKNLAEGHFLTYSVGEPYSNGCTSFIYYLLCAGLYKAAQLVPSLNDVIFVQASLLGIATGLLFLSAYVFYRSLQTIAGKKLGPVTMSLLTAGVFTCNPITYAWFSGTEYPLHVLSLLLVAISISTRRVWLLGLSIVLLDLGRPEGIVAAFLVLVAITLTWRDRRLASIWFIFILTAPIVPVLNLAYVGKIIPNSACRTDLLALFHPEQFLRNAFWTVATFLGVFVLNPGTGGTVEYERLCLAAVVVFTVFPFVRAWRQGVYGMRDMQRIFQKKNTPIGLTVIMLTPMLVAIWVGRTGEWSRYVTCVYPIFVLLLTAVALRSGLGEIYLRRFFLGALIATVFLSPLWIKEYRRAQFAISHGLHRAGNYLKTHVNPGEKVVVDQAGILSLLNPGITIDSYGLGTTRYAFWPRSNGRVVELLSQDRPEWCVTYDWDYKGYGSPSYYLRNLPSGATAQCVYIAEMPVPVVPNSSLYKFEVYRIFYPTE